MFSFSNNIHFNGSWNKRYPVVNFIYEILFLTLCNLKVFCYNLLYFKFVKLETCQHQMKVFIPLNFWGFSMSNILYLLNQLEKEFKRSKFVKYCMIMTGEVNLRQRIFKTYILFKNLFSIEIYYLKDFFLNLNMKIFYEAIFRLNLTFPNLKVL